MGELRARQDELGKHGVTAKTSLARCGELESALDQTTTMSRGGRGVQQGA